MSFDTDDYGKIFDDIYDLNISPEDYKKYIYESINSIRDFRDAVDIKSRLKFIADTYQGKITQEDYERMLDDINEILKKKSN